MMIELLSSETPEYMIRAYEVVKEQTEADCYFLLKQSEAGLRLFFARRLAGVKPGGRMRSAVFSCSPWMELAQTADGGPCRWQYRL
jgi:hypothetical protein